MRFATVLSLLALSSISTASAACQPGAGGLPDLAQTPDADALTIFVTLTRFSALFKGSASSDIGSGKTAGLTGADNICTNAAKNTAAQASYNQNQNFPTGGSNTVAFRAVLSDSVTSAYSRIIPSDPTLDVKSWKAGSGFQCVAASVDDLWKSSDNLGYNLDTAIFYDDGTIPSGATGIWTGTGVPKEALGWTGLAGNEAADAVALAAATAESYGGRFFTANAGGTPPADYTTQATTYNCNNYATGGSSANSGFITAGAPAGAARNTWIVRPSANLESCSNQVRLLCISAQGFAEPTPPSVNSDPQFVGLQGQHFQVHGMPEEYFNLITTPAFQLNSRFTYLASGQCNYNNTECWTHPGTYVDQLGFQFPGLAIKAVAGPHHKGLRVWVNDEELHRSAGRLELSSTNSTGGVVTVAHPHHDTLSVSFPLFSFEVTNSDWFFNFNLAFHAPDVLAAGRNLHFLQDARQAQNKPAQPHYLEEPAYPVYPMHGLVGQTWKNARYPSKRMYQGDVDDYMLLDHQLFSTQFMYNLYQF